MLDAENQDFATQTSVAGSLRRGVPGQSTHFERTRAAHISQSLLTTNHKGV